MQALLNEGHTDNVLAQESSLYCKTDHEIV